MMAAIYLARLRRRVRVVDVGASLAALTRPSAGADRPAPAMLETVATKKRLFKRPGGNCIPAKAARAKLDMKHMSTIKRYATSSGS
jgi:hypothetical protein